MDKRITDFNEIDSKTVYSTGQPPENFIYKDSKMIIYQSSENTISVFTIEQNTIKTYTTSFFANYYIPNIFDKACLIDSTNLFISTFNLLKNHYETEILLAINQISNNIFARTKKNYDNAKKVTLLVKNIIGSKIESIDKKYDLQVSIYNLMLRLIPRITRIKNTNQLNHKIYKINSDNQTPDEPENCIICLNDLEDEQDILQCVRCNIKCHIICMHNAVYASNACPHCRNEVNL